MFTGYIKEYLLALMSDAKDFKLKFDGIKSHIDAEILINSLLHTSNIISEINNFNKEKKININIKALEKGSFLIHISLDQNTIELLQTLISRDTISYLSEVIAIFIGTIELKKWLQGKSIKDIEKIEESNNNNLTLKNSDNNTIVIDKTVYNIYVKNPNIRASITKQFESIDKDEAITAFEITDLEEKPYIRVDKEDFKILATEIDNKSKDDKTIHIKAVLTIVTVSFEQANKWKFIYDDNKISAKIKDDAYYLQKIDKGESFAKGDKLEVELEVYKQWDEELKTHVNKSYVVNKIFNHIPKAKQIKLNNLLDD